ncbi:hypothetical protein, partial [Okeania sp. SIO2B3]|uniref:hypothetical protein n=1 Tax=Okeania sp. SIO2B3 TaxID=2607784 RepID=UPI0013BF5327
ALGSDGYELAKTYPADEDLIDVLSQASAVNNAGRRTVIYLAIVEGSVRLPPREQHPVLATAMRSKASTCRGARGGVTYL